MSNADFSRPKKYRGLSTSLRSGRDDTSVGAIGWEGMSDGLTVQINGVERSFAELRAGAPLAGVVDALGLKADRVAVELNGEIAPRTAWAERLVKDGDRLEIVHFVGGGFDKQEQRQKRSRRGRKG